MALLITIAVLTTFAWIASVILIRKIDIQIGPDEDDPHGTKLCDDMRLARLRDAADDLLPEPSKPEGGA